MGMEFTQGRSNRNNLLYNLEEEPPHTTATSTIPPTSSAASSPSSSPVAAAAAAFSAGSADAMFVEKEHMFDKVVTPSDVGKLNRLVIPKQHAEKYFPLDPSSNEKGLLLSFEDRQGKPWRFRYSYWNSSQSYVMTKGWSRFVKEKRLGAGDTVSFCRGIGEAGRGRLFIDWRRRPDPLIHDHPYTNPRPPLPFVPWTTAARLLIPPNDYSSTSRQHQQILFYRPQRYAVQPPSVPMVLDSVPVSNSQSTAGTKRVRLFGVNLDCPDSGGESSTTTTTNNNNNMNRRNYHLEIVGNPLPPPQTVLQLSPHIHAESSSSGKEQLHSLDLDL